MDIDGSRYLLGDEVGGLHMLVLVHDGEKVVGLKLEALGRTSAPSTISYLDSGVVFVVSNLSQLALQPVIHNLSHPAICAVSVVSKRL